MLSPVLFPHLPTLGCHWAGWMRKRSSRHWRRNKLDCKHLRYSIYTRLYIYTHGNLNVPCCLLLSCFTRKSSASAVMQLFWLVILCWFFFSFYLGSSIRCLPFAISVVTEVVAAVTDKLSGLIGNAFGLCEKLANCLNFLYLRNVLGDS